MSSLETLGSIIMTHVLFDHDDLMAVLEGSHCCFSATGTPSQLERERSRSKGRCRIPHGSSGGSSDAEQIAHPQAEVSVGVEESGLTDNELLDLYPLNVIEPTPVDDEDWVRRQSLQQTKALCARFEQEARARDVDSCSRAASSVSLGSSYSPINMAAARAACRESFGSSNSVFLQGAIMMQLLRGGSSGYDLISCWVETLPRHLRDSAAHQLKELCRQPDVRLMQVCSNVPREAEAKVRLRMQSSHYHEFYVGISERPLCRFDEHRAGRGFELFWLWVFDSSSESAAAEKALLHNLIDCSACLNRGHGGERASAGRPHYMYIAWRKASGTAFRQA